MKLSLFRYLEQLATDRWTRQGIRTLLRSAWLGACIWCIGLGGHLIWDWPLRYNILGALALAIIGMGVALLLRPKLSSYEVARRLDRRFQLNEQLTTAVEVARSHPPRDSIAAHLLVQSGRTAGSLQQVIMRQQRPPWSDIIAFGALILVALGLYMLAGIGAIDQSLVGASIPPLPQLVQSQDPQLTQEPFNQSGGQPGTGGSGTTSQTQPGQNGQSTAGNPQTLGPIADALRDQGATRPAADALDHGDAAGAAQQLRALADQADQISPRTLDNLASRLEGAADKVQSNNPDLADQLRKSAEELQRGNKDASQGFEDLARSVEQAASQNSATGTPPQQQADQSSAQDQQGDTSQQNDQNSQGQTGSQSQAGQGNQNGQGSSSGEANSNTTGEQRQAPQTGRLGVEGQPMELKADGTGQDAQRSPDQQPSTADASKTAGSTQGGRASDQTVQTGADPLRVPMDERDVVQEYFTP